MRWNHALKALTNGKKTWGDLPQTDPTMDCKSILFNTGLSDPREVNNLMNNKVCWVFVDEENNIQLIHSLVFTTEGYIGILGDKVNSSQRVLLGGVTTLTSCFISIGDKGVTTTGNQRFLDDPGTKDLKAVGGPPSPFITPLLLGMSEGADSQIVVVLKMFPFKLGETIPSGHSLNNPLPEVGHYPDGFVAWFAALRWASTKNNKKPITGTDGGIFNNTNWEPTLGDEDSAGEKVLRQVQQPDRQSKQLLIVPILSTSTAYKSSLVSTKISASTKFDN